MSMILLKNCRKVASAGIARSYDDDATRRPSSYVEKKFRNVTLLGARRWPENRWVDVVSMV